MKRLGVASVLLIGMSGLVHAAIVQLDSGGNVTGVFAGPQPAIPGVQQVPDNDPRVGAFLTAQAKLLTSPPDRMKRLTDLLISKGVITTADQVSVLGP
jgi:hypothetical protein